MQLFSTFIKSNVGRLIGTPGRFSFILNIFITYTSAHYTQNLLLLPLIFTFPKDKAEFSTYSYEFITSQILNVLMWQI